MRHETDDFARYGFNSADDARRIAELEAKLLTRVPFVHAILFAIGVGILSALGGAGVVWFIRG